MANPAAGHRHHAQQPLGTRRQLPGSRVPAYHTTSQAAPRTRAGTTWPKIRREVDRIYIGTFTGPAGTFWQLTDPAKPTRDLLAKLSIDQTRKIRELTAPRT